MIYESVEDLIIDDVFFKAKAYCRDIDVYIKLEGLNPAGSIKLKPAKYMIEHAEKTGVLNKNSKIIESSSGNLGVALSHICASKNYPFTCVTDINACQQNINTMKALGAEVIVIDRVDSHHGYLENRLAYIRERLQADSNMIWLNQYANLQNIQSHYDMTARSLLNEFDSIDYLFVGTSTTGTLMGCLKRFKAESKHTRVIAVDAKGSINFSDKAGARYLSGLGASRRPEILDRGIVEDVMLIDERDTIRHCYTLAKQYGLLAGASTGTMLAAVEQLSTHIKPSDTVVTLSPDLGRSYLETLYNASWVQNTYGTKC